MEVFQQNPDLYEREIITEEASRAVVWGCAGMCSHKTQVPGFVLGRHVSVLARAGRGLRGLGARCHLTAVTELPAARDHAMRSLRLARVAD